MSFFEDIGRNNAQLSHLRTALTQLPHSIPLGNSKYNFEHYAPDPERVELYGSTDGQKDESAPCPFEFQERGPGLVAVVDVLTAADSNSDSEDNWLEESEDPEIERDPIEDAHLDAPRLLDLLSEKPVEGASRTPQIQDSTVPTPPGGPVHLSKTGQKLVFNSCQKPLEGGDRPMKRRWIIFFTGYEFSPCTYVGVADVTLLVAGAIIEEETEPMKVNNDTIIVAAHLPVLRAKPHPARQHFNCLCNLVFPFILTEVLVSLPYLDLDISFEAL
ncbi:uncharacterized protein F5147DRAFT_764422 [Suillus discolor]|uniref:Uncharacterized protein n=1 Tax=Suillus discolor TaxID=1912936 RepID=A0A9P7ETR7_9AGAM|nr:uncharacterized protein F5147DRAFT_764422 [Suillus discolor]KAG2090365.1 hypothetical protein F5147DRAFT_764422 [Suillus discolor]